MVGDPSNHLTSVCQTNYVNLVLFWTWFFARSLAACELLYNAGYTNLFWVQGGFDAAEEEACFPISFFWISIVLY